MKTIIEVECNDQLLEAISSPLIASGGRHEDFVQFSFCEKWVGFKKTAVFYRESKTPTPYYSDIDEMNMCEIPHEVTDDSGTIYFGVFGVLGDVTRTSNMLKYKINNGAITTNLEPTDPSPDIWEQLLSSYNTLTKRVEAIDESVQKLINGDTKAGDSAKLNGHDDEYFATAEGLKTVKEDLEKVMSSTLVFLNIEVPVESWKEEGASLTYPFKADIACPGVTKDYFSDVIFNLREASSGNYAPTSETSENVVSIYAMEIPMSTVTISIIKCEKVVAEE